jgi:hypothetical protein
MLHFNGVSAIAGLIVVEMGKLDYIRLEAEVEVAPIHDLCNDHIDHKPYY